MSIVSTDKWLDKWYSNPVEICEKLEPYFQSFEARTIHHLLTMNGMYQRPVKDITKFTERLPEIFNIVKKEHHILRKAWNGPDVPIFIFPSDPNNKRIVREFNGKSGIAFKDKLFLFLSEKNTKEEIRALFTHEYNHVCRLTHFSKEEQDFTLLDTIILEGLAENAVYERLGEKHLAPWTSYYTKTKLQTIWHNIIHPNKDISIHHRKHQQILYGLNFIPKMAGYAVGYYVVNLFMKERDTSISRALHLNSEEIAKDFIKMIDES